MYTTPLRHVDGAVMLVVPPTILDLLGLKAGSLVNIEVEGETLVVKATPRPLYTLDELLSQCDSNQDMTNEEMEWVGMKPVGRELVLMEGAGIVSAMLDCTIVIRLLKDDFLSVLINCPQLSHLLISRSRAYLAGRECRFYHMR